MLQYILNTSAIWLLSLLVFDLFLRRETFHSYNRFYLLSTFTIGLLLPLWQLQEATVQYTATLGSRPIAHNAALLKETISNSQPAAAALGLSTLIWSIYIAGLVLAAILLLKDLITLSVAYNKGNKFKDGVWTVIETSRPHSPYSAFRFVFISSRENYTEEQLRIILTHEEQHGHLLHFFDLLFMQLAKIVFWFHPLVYLYNERLATVHEFQADAAVDKPPKEYGQFLIEQAILQSAPALSHSFNRSPIKKRIIMLTRHSSALSKSKLLLALPLLLVSALCFSKNALSDNTRITDGNKVTFHGNTFIVRKHTPDTTIVTDPTTGKDRTFITVKDGLFVESMNGKKVYGEQDFQGAYAYDNTSLKSEALKEYLLGNLKEEIKQLKDGDYYLLMDCLTVDENGKIVYYNYGGISTSFDDVAGVETDGAKNVQDAFAKKIDELIMNAPKHKPANIKGQNVPVQIYTNIENTFTVKGGKVTRL
ncbi:MAG: M56 family metallopeptidase [Bacteroidetes bacterium]|nr:M56 family metallopeptidase [Bacteroidota bacterium]